MKRISQEPSEVFGWRDIIGDSTDRNGVLAEINILPLSKDANNEVASKPPVEDLGEEVEVLDDGGLEDDGEGRGVEELDLVSLDDSSDLPMDEVDLHPESLEVNHKEGHEESSAEVAHVGGVHPPERMVQRS